VKIENIAKLELGIKQREQHMAQSGAVFPSHLGDMVRELEDEKRALKVFEERKADLTKQIAALECPTPEQARARLAVQRQLAALARKRVDADKVIAQVCEELRAQLEERRQLCEEMRALAAEIDFDSNSGFGEHRFDALLAALPENLPAESGEHTRRFLGEPPEGAIGCCVIASVFAVPETLVHSGWYASGETVFLSPPEAAEAASKGFVALPEDYVPVRVDLAESEAVAAQ
jgi:hypothetical protein